MKRRIATVGLLIAATAALTGLTAAPANAAPTPVVGPSCWQVPPGWAGLCQPGWPWPWS
jgi:hypothetical protein